MNREEVVGKYVCHFPEGVAELELKWDGTFRQSFREPDGRLVLSNSGNWAFRTSPIFGSEVNLTNYVVVHDPVGDFDKTHSGAVKKYSYPVGRWFGAVYLSPHPDAARRFDKDR